MMLGKLSQYASSIRLARSQYRHPTNDSPSSHTNIREGERSQTLMTARHLKVTHSDGFEFMQFFNKYIFITLLTWFLFVCCCFMP